MADMRIRYSGVKLVHNFTVWNEAGKAMAWADISLALDGRYWWEFWLSTGRVDYGYADTLDKAVDELVFQTKFHFRTESVEVLKKEIMEEVESGAWLT